MAKLILEKLRSIMKSKEEEVMDDPALISNNDDDGSTSSHQRPYMVALVGVPGGGKSVSSLILATMLEEQGVPTMIMPHDGYHLPMDQLRQYPDAKDKIYRRGAPDTFDPASLLRDLDRIRNNPHDEEGLIMVPGFEHAKGDPEPDTHFFDRNHHRVVLGEGLYLLHDGDGWEEIASYFDLKIFIESDVDNCMERLKIRNSAIPGYTEEEILVRVDAVDRVNAATVIASKKRADLVVESVVNKPPKTKHTAGMGRHTRVPSFEALNLIVTSIEAEQEPHGIADFFESSQSLIYVEPLQPMAPMVGTWEKDMAQQIIRRIQEKPLQRPFMVGLVGMPGSGKSASAFLLANELEQKGIMSMTMPHDGYHYTIDYLKSFAYSDDVIYRRGAPDTLDPASLYRDMDRIRNNTLGEDLIKVPGFDHAKGDPEPDQHVFDRRHHDVVICEGLYLLHEEDGWHDIKELLDFSIFMESDVDICVERVKIRNQCIPGYSRDEIIERAERVDRINAITVLASKYRADVIVSSTAKKTLPADDYC